MIVEVNIDDSRFSESLRKASHGIVINEKSSTFLIEPNKEIKKLLAAPAESNTHSATKATTKRLSIQQTHSLLTARRFLSK